MSPKEPEKQLIVLVSDKDMQFTVRGILSKPKRLGISPLTQEDHTIYVHPEHDAACYLKAHEYLKLFTKKYKYALVLFDREFDKKNELPRADLEAEVEKNLSRSGWRNRCAAIVIDPELERWVWSGSSHVDNILGWKGQKPPLRKWLKNKGHVQSEKEKPARPKEAMRAALRAANKSPSSALFGRLAQKVSLKNCTDEAFLKFKNTLQQWFPPQ